MAILWTKAPSIFLRFWVVNALMVCCFFVSNQSSCECVDTDGDLICDELDPCPLDNPDDPDGNGVCGDGSNEVCGNGSCVEGESCWSCAPDCGACNCPTPAEVVIYTFSSWNLLANAFVQDPSPCADYYLSLPSIAGDKTTPRGGGEPEAMRARGRRIHAMAEFHWQTWKNAAGTWYERGVEFRRRMVEAGYDVNAGDTWAINELPSTVRSDPAARTDAIEAMRGLYDGPSGSPKAKGAVFIIGMGQGTVNFSVYKPNLKNWLEDQDFWVNANLYARWWAQEVYADPHYICVPDTVTGLRSEYTNDYVEHVARLAEVGPDSVNTAQSYLGRAYTPLMNAVWMAAAGYGNTQIELDQMKHFVSGEVYAARAWAGSHGYPDGRIGFAWGREAEATNDQLTDLASRLASAIHYAYNEGGGEARYACSPSGAYTWCQCSISGAQFNEAWKTFSTW